MNESMPRRRLPIVSDAAPPSEATPHDADDAREASGASDATGAGTTASAAPTKRLMNEVLPSPTRERPRASARQRTLERMARLVTIAAASSVLGARCQPGATPPTPAQPDHATGYAVVDPVPPPAVDASAPADAVSATVGPPNNPGYIVVDPMPPPHRDGRRGRGR